MVQYSKHKHMPSAKLYILITSGKLARDHYLGGKLARDHYLGTCLPSRNIPRNVFDHPPRINALIFELRRSLQLLVRFALLVVNAAQPLPHIVQIVFTGVVFAVVAYKLLHKRPTEKFSFGLRNIRKGHERQYLKVSLMSNPTEREVSVHILGVLKADPLSECRGIGVWSGLHTHLLFQVRYEYPPMDLAEVVRDVYPPGSQRVDPVHQDMVRRG